MTKYRFARHCWKPRYCRTPSEVCDTLALFGAFDKVVKAVHTIGIALNMEEDDCRRELRHTLASQGVSYDDIDSGRYPHIDRTLLPHRVEVCEPIVFVFEDDSTLELLPRGCGGLLIGKSQIPPDALDGTNYHNYDSACFFEKLIGHALQRVSVYKKCDTPKAGKVVERGRVKYQLHFDGPYGAFLEQRWFGRSFAAFFDFGLTEQGVAADWGNAVAEAPFGEFKRVMQNKRQILIAEGNHDDGCFWIVPIRHDIARRSVEEYEEETITVHDEHVGEFLYYFLEKYFDKDYPYEGIRAEYYPNEFLWNLEYNVYTYDAIAAMLEEIECCCRLLKTDYDHPTLAAVKRRFSVYTLAPDLLRWGEPCERAKAIRENISVAIDFYERFVCRMRAMMKYAKHCDRISFMGP